MFKVLLYYKYVTVPNAKQLCKSQLALCKSLELKGRILISEEGINGTLAGDEESVSKYIVETTKIPEFADIEWKVSYEKVNPFPRMRVVYREEIVTLGLVKKGKDANVANKADYIEPKELKELYKNDEEFYIIDARNEYEARIGKFKNAITFDVKSFREIPEKLGEIENLKDKPVVTYCTGGVRCEKFSAYLKEQGFKNVRQLHGGIFRYGEEAGGENFDGEMYVFDNRVSVKVNSVNPTTISECVHCKEKITRFINCTYNPCNEQFICCEKCEDEFKGACSDECMEKLAQSPDAMRNKPQSVSEVS